MALVAPGVCRFSVLGRIHERPWVNVIDIDIDTAVFGDRNACILDQAKVILNNYWDHIAPLCSPQWFLDGVRWVDLNAADGETGETSSTTGARPMPKAGGNSGESENGSVCMLIRKNVATGRGKRRGRMYVSGVSEGSATGQGFSGAFISAAETHLPALRDGINQEATPVVGTSGYDSRIVVVHTTLGGADFNGMDTVTGLALDPRCATQRRRLRG